MVLGAVGEFIDPYEDSIGGTPLDGQKSQGGFRNNIVKLVIGAVVFLNIVAIYNASFSAWEVFVGRGSRAQPDEARDLQETDNAITRITYAIVILIIGWIVVVVLAKYNPRLWE